MPQEVLCARLAVRPAASAIHSHPAGLKHLLCDGVVSEPEPVTNQTNGSPLVEFPLRFCQMAANAASTREEVVSRGADTWLCGKSRAGGEGEDPVIDAEGRTFQPP